MKRFKKPLGKLFQRRSSTRLMYYLNLSALFAPSLSKGQPIDLPPTKEIYVFRYFVPSCSFVPSCQFRFEFFAQQDDDVVRVNTELVVLNITVTDKAGQYVPGLKLSDFKVFEDGKEVPASCDREFWCPRVSLCFGCAVGYFGKHGESFVAGPLGSNQVSRWASS